MKTPRWFTTSVRGFAPEVRSLHSLVILALAGLHLGCATERPATLTRAGAAAAEPVWIEPGAVVITAPETPAAVGFDRGRGQIESTGVRTQDAVRNVLALPPLPADSALVAGAVGLAAVPVAAVVGATQARSEYLAPDAFTRGEQNLQRALEAMASQAHLRDTLMRTAGAQTQRQLLPMQAVANPRPGSLPVSAVLESKIEELRLERTGPREDSFALVMKARARVVRAADGKVLYDEPFEYRSGTALYHDWTLATAVQTVADTGYRKLAERMTERLFLAGRDQPTLVGAGFRKPHSPSPLPQQTTMLATTTAPGGLTPVVYRFADSGTFGIYSTSSVGGLVIQTPKTKREAVMEEQTRTEARLKELDQLNDPYVAVAALAIALPFTVWEQTKGCINGIKEKEFEPAYRSITKAAWEQRPHELLAFAVAQQLTPHTSQAVALVKKPQPTGDLHQAALMQCADRGTFTALPRGVRPGDHLASQGMSKALEIHITRAVLRGEGDINPPMALHLEATATVIRTSDGQMLYSCPVRYQGRPRMFVEWAAQDAKLLREEMQTCYAELGRTITAQLVARKVLPPKGGAENLLATNEP